MAKSASLAGPRLRRNAVASLLDQGVNSFGNFALFVLLARQSSPEVFGKLALLLGAIAFVVGTAQALFGEPALLSQSFSDRVNWSAGRVAGAALAGASATSAIAFLVLASVALLTRDMLVMI